MGTTVKIRSVVKAFKRQIATKYKNQKQIWFALKQSRKMFKHLLLLGSVLILKSSEGLAKSSDPCKKDLNDATDYSKNKRGACSITSPNPFLANMDIVIFHERCHCNEWIVDDCKKVCDNDANCKGFVEKLSQDENWNWYSSGCQYATVDGASTCKSSGCTYYKSDGEGTDNWGMTGVGRLLDESADGGYCGCWRKKSLIKAP